MTYRGKTPQQWAAEVRALHATGDAAAGIAVSWDVEENAPEAFTEAFFDLLWEPEQEAYDLARRAGFEPFIPE